MAQNDRVRDLVESFSAELEQLIKAEIRRGFETALGTPSPASRRGPAAKSATAPKPNAKFANADRKKGEKRTPSQLLAVKKALADYITRHAGERIEEIAKGLAIPSKDLSRPAKQLIEAKSIKTTGEKRATKYYPR